MGQVCTKLYASMQTPMVIPTSAKLKIPVLTGPTPMFIKSTPSRMPHSSPLARKIEASLANQPPGSGTPPGFPRIPSGPCCSNRIGPQTTQSFGCEFFYPITADASRENERKEDKSCQPVSTNDHLEESCSLNVVMTRIILALSSLTPPLPHSPTAFPSLRDA